MEASSPWRTSNKLRCSLRKSIENRDGHFKRLTGLRLFRSQALSQSYNLASADQLVGTTAKQTISFEFGENGLKQRIDRDLTYDNYWRYAHPTLKNDFTLVVQTGPNATACFNKGAAADHPAVPWGYADSYLTDYLVHSAEQSAILDVLKRFYASKSELRYSVTHNKASGVGYPTLSLSQLNLQLLVNNGTWLPYAVRSTENHGVYGQSTNDVVFSNYANVSFGTSRTINYPTLIQTIYNDIYVIEDITVENITANAQFPTDFFRAVPQDAPEGVPGDPYHPHAPHTDEEYPRSEVHEFYESGIWYGPFGKALNASSVVVKPVFPGGNVPQIQNLCVGGPGYTQLLIEFDDGLVITDAPAHRSKLILQWVKENMHGKKITHVVPSHHHRDHTGGIGDYLAAGAKLVIPEIARGYYEKVNNGSFGVEVYSQDEPFIKKDKNVQFMSFWRDENPHARDWVYSVAGPACGQFNKSEVVVFNADVINPNFGPVPNWDTAEAMPFFIDVVRQGIPREATLVGTHGMTPLGLGSQDSLAHLADIAGFSYPNLSGTETWCRNQA